MRSLPRWVSWVVAPSITIAVFAYLFSQVDAGEILRALRRVDRGAMAAFGAVLLTGVVARSLRFWVLLERRVRLPLLVGIVLARNLFIDLLPARLGELAFVYLVRRHGGRSAAEGLASVVSAAVLDAAVLAPTLLLAIAIAGGGASLSMAQVAVFATAAVGVTIVGALLAAPVIVGVERRWAAVSKSTRLGRLHARFGGELRQLAASLQAVQRRGVLLPALLLTLLVRACKFGSYYALVVAILAPMGFRSSVQGVASVFLGVQSAELAAMLPVHGVAGFGSYEAAWAFSFERLGFPRDQAILSAVLGHAISQVVEYVLGGAALIVLSLVARMRRTPRAGDDESGMTR
jgi:uncharacterized protein (TIRG00374 family)